MRPAERLFEDASARLRNVKQAPDGKLYLLTDETDGRSIRIDADWAQISNIKRRIINTCRIGASKSVPTRSRDE